MRSFIGAVLLFGLMAGGCTEPHSDRCKTVCEREAQCADQSARAEIRFDQQECVSACAALERDAEGKKYVDLHAGCVGKADSCDELYACNFAYQEPEPGETE